MSKQIAKKSGRKPQTKPVTQLEAFTEVPRDNESMMDWLRRFESLPPKQKNLAIRANPEVVDLMYGERLRGGELLIGPLAAESQGDRDAGETTFLTVLKPLRDRLIKDYDIKTGAELMLLDALVLSYYQYLRASSALHTYIGYGKSFNYETLVRYAQTYVARASDQFLRNLEALRRMKAAPFVIRIEQAGQVNVGEKQVNVSGSPPSGAAEVVLTGQSEEVGGAPEQRSVPALPSKATGAE